MAYLDIEVWDLNGDKRETVELPDDEPVNRIIVVLTEKLNYPRFDSNGGQLLSYKLHHKETRKQLPDNLTLQQCRVGSGDVLRLIPEIVAG